MNLLSFALATANVVLPPPGQVIGTFDYKDSMTNCSLQMSPNVKQWFGVPEEAVTVWWDGSWIVNDSFLHGSAIIDGKIVNDISASGKMFFRIKGQTNTTQQ